MRALSGMTKKNKLILRNMVLISSQRQWHLKIQSVKFIQTLDIVGRKNDYFALERLEVGLWQFDLRIVVVKSESSALDIGERGRSIMYKRRVDSDMPIGKMTRIADFLPPPNELVVPSRTVKITLRLDQSSVNFFKREARKYHTKYQKMIRELLDRYAFLHHSKTT